jgi:hypothetical protein
MPRRKRIYGKRRKRVKSPLKFYGKAVENVISDKNYMAGQTTGGKILDTALGPLAGFGRRLFKPRAPKYDHATMRNPANVVQSAPTYNFPASPMQKKGKKSGKYLDRFQTVLSGAGTVFPQADALNALVSGGRAVYAKATGDDDAYKKHRNATALNAAAIIPGVGETIKATKAGKLLKTMPTKQLTDATKSVKNLKNISKSTSKAKDLMNVVSTGGNIGYWGGTVDQLGGEVKDQYKKLTTPKSKNREIPVTVREREVTKQNLA